MELNNYKERVSQLKQLFTLILIEMGQFEQKTLVGNDPARKTFNPSIDKKIVREMIKEFNDVWEPCADLERVLLKFKHAAERTCDTEIWKEALANSSKNKKTSTVEAPTDVNSFLASLSPEVKAAMKESVMKAAATINDQKGSDEPIPPKP